MKNERFFKALSVALLGLFALAFVPETNATDSQVAVEEVPAEVTIAREVEEINAGRFNAATAGEEKQDSLVLSPVLTTTLSAVDPNL